MNPARYIGLRYELEAMGFDIEEPPAPGCRVLPEPERTRLAEATGDSPETIDTVLWRASEQGLIDTRALWRAAA